ncbi:hypothetical protein NA57DRAFT_51716 [Rhizodiscina lignyota]|uniref:C3H1-type domain-containing protein n=1 Tax=Rhizodiscina lignyota TaxID=1504668 RepID=A0A9P4IPK4_9PEZI|nr:hypothetical protein NA57DRAFT_51716 [Rhizodiscina lignyota]
MAWSPSIGDILALYDLAQSIYVGCRNAPDEFTAVQINVCSIMCSVSAISRASKDKRSILNRDESTRRDVRTQSGMCHQLLTQVREVQKKYPNRNMTVSQRAAWHFSDRAKLYDKVGQLDKLVQNFSTFLNILGLVSPQDIEPEFDRTTDANIATDSAISKSGRSVSKDDRNMLLEYARHMREYERLIGEQPNAISLVAIQQRLECWTIDTVTARNNRDSTIGMPKKQERSQIRLQQMAEEFQNSTFRLPDGDRHERVRRILELRNVRENSRSIRWVYVAGRVVEYESIGADDSATQTVMVIIRAMEDDAELRKTRPIRPPSRTRSTENLRPQYDARKSPEPGREKTRAIPLPVSRAPLPDTQKYEAIMTQAITRPQQRPHDGLLNPQPTRIVRVVSDPGRKPHLKLPPGSSRGTSPTPSDIASVTTTNTIIKRIHTDGRCKWGAKCMTRRCPNKHPPLCEQGDKCRSLSCFYEHPTLFLCPNGVDCRRDHCNKEHGSRQCKQDPCTDDNCAMRHCAGQKAVLGWWAIQRMD